MDSNHCMLESKSSALPLGDSPTTSSYFYPLRTLIIIQKKIDFVNTFFIIFQYFNIGVLYNQA